MITELLGARRGCPEDAVVVIALLARRSTGDEILAATDPHLDVNVRRGRIGDRLMVRK